MPTHRLARERALSPKLFPDPLGLELPGPYAPGGGERRCNPSGLPHRCARAVIVNEAAGRLAGHEQPLQPLREERCIRQLPAAPPLAQARMTHDVCDAVRARRRAFFYFRPGHVIVRQASGFARDKQRAGDVRMYVIQVRMLEARDVISKQPVGQPLPAAQFEDDAREVQRIIQPRESPALRMYPIGAPPGAVVVEQEFR